ncbi:carbohydrate esterase family 4 protein [Hypomontagnella submonticulosa]|nr:carbohydrate esterase family 4 protein [Hypomontagnella submonticulosa]
MPRPHRGSVPYAGDSTIFTCTQPGQVALTFDDGPWHYTARIMDLLERHGARGTFFVTGHNLFLHRRMDDESGPYPDLLRAMVRRGHQVGSHTWTHPHLGAVGSEERVNQMVWNEMALRNVLGVVPTYMRPPYGEWRDASVRRDLDALGYHVVMYDVDTKDYKHNSEESIEDSIAVFESAVREDGNASYIVLCHDIREWTALRLVPAMLRILGERGYRAVTVGECLGDPERLWYRDPEESGRAVEEIT